MTKSFILTIRTDRDIANKYPNYRLNYGGPLEFIAGVVREVEALGRDSNGQQTFGYSITIGAVEGWEVAHA